MIGSNSHCGKFLSNLSDTLKPCSTYMISVKSWTSDNLFGQTTPIKIITKDTAPLAPSNLHVEETSQHGFTVRWCAPNQDPQCSKVHGGLTLNTLSQQTFLCKSDIQGKFLFLQRQATDTKFQSLSMLNCKLPVKISQLDISFHWTYLALKNLDTTSPVVLRQNQPWSCLRHHLP